MKEILVGKIRENFLSMFHPALLLGVYARDLWWVNQE
jgi:hypothetical protein